MIPDTYNDKRTSIQFTREPDAGLQLQAYYKRIEENVRIETGFLDKTNTQFIDLDFLKLNSYCA